MSIPRCFAAALAAVLCLTGPGAAFADYRIGKEDVLQISVWLHPELERSVTVNAEGKVSLPPIGDLVAENLTTKELGERIAERLTTYLRGPTQVTVTVAQYNSLSVYVSGGVSRPGRYGFETIPGVVEVIGTAGGVTVGADLSRVQIIRREGDTRRTLLADVASHLRTEGQSELPELRPGDTIVVPVAAGTGAAATGSSEAVAVIGEVQKPGLYAVGAGQDILQVLGQAGGMTSRADLRRVRVVSRNRGAQIVSTLDVKNIVEHGSPSLFLVQSGDAVFIGPSGSSVAGQVWASFGSVMSVATDLLNVAVLYEVLVKEN
jgi:polysaccharide export outer membrane protein